MRKTRKIFLLAGILGLTAVMQAFAMVNAACGPESAQFTQAGPGSVQQETGAPLVMEASRKNPSQQGPGSAGPSGPGEAAAQATQAAQTQTVTSGGRAIDPAKPMIAITYDDGPQTEAGNRIIDTYLKYNQRCTFFVVGDRVASRASEVKRMAENGFEIGNHSYSHKYLNKCDAQTIRSEIAKCNEAIAAATGITPTVMRLPGGNKNDTVLANVNMPIILWNVDTRDWDHRNAQKSIDAVVGKVKDGDIVLMHELYGATADATEVIVPKLLEQGFQLVTVSELAAYKGKQLNPNQIYYSF